MPIQTDPANLCEEPSTPHVKPKCSASSSTCSTPQKCAHEKNEKVSSADPSNSDTCSVCGRHVGKRYMTRDLMRHRCRLCHKCVCGGCSPSLIQLAGRKEPERVCSACVTNAFPNVTQDSVVQRLVTEMSVSNVDVDKHAGQHEIEVPEVPETLQEAGTSSHNSKLDRFAGISLDAPFYGRPEPELQSEASVSGAQYQRDIAHEPDSQGSHQLGYASSHERTPSKGSGSSRMGALAPPINKFSHRRVPSTQSTSTTCSLEVRMEGDQEHQVRRWCSGSTDTMLSQQLHDDTEVRSFNWTPPTPNRIPSCDDVASQCEYAPIAEETAFSSLDPSITYAEAVSMDPVSCSRVKKFFRRAFSCTVIDE